MENFKLRNGNCIKVMNVNTFLKCKPTKQQMYKGEHQISRKRVERLKLVIRDALRAKFGGFIKIRNNEIACGNHRFVAVKEEYEAGRLEGAFEFDYIEESNETSTHHVAKVIYLDNNGNNKENRAKQQIFNSFDLSTKVFRVLYAALDMGITKKVLTNSEKEKFSRHCGAFFNKNPHIVKALQNNYSIDIYGADIHNSKNSKECSDEFVDLKANVDLRGMVNKFYTLFRDGLLIIDHIKKSGQFGNSKFPSALLYVILTASLIGKAKEISKTKNIITKKRVDIINSNPRKSLELSTACGLWHNGAGKQEAKILTLLTNG